MIYQLISVVDEYVDTADLETFRRAYEEQAKRGEPSAISTFNYAHALIRSSKDNVRTGIFLLEGLLKRDITDGSKRDYVYYLAVANTRMKEYDRALTYLDVLLTAESDNRQAIALKELVNDRMKKESLFALGILGIGGGLAVAAAAIGRSFMLFLKIIYQL